MSEEPLLRSGRGRKKYSRDGDEYEELLGGRVPCPTCEGEGSIPSSTGLIALIPFNDARLRPPKTWLWVMLCMIVMLAIGGVTAFFLVPRSVKLHSCDYAIRDVKSPLHINRQLLTLTFKNHVVVDNNNYFAITAKSVTSNVINRYQPINHLIIGQGKSDFPPNGKYCESGLTESPLYILLQFDITVDIGYLLHTEQETVTAYQMVCCTPHANCTAAV